MSKEFEKVLTILISVTIKSVALYIQRQRGLDNRIIDMIDSCVTHSFTLMGMPIPRLIVEREKPESS